LCTQVCVRVCACVCVLGGGAGGGRAAVGPGSHRRVHNMHSTAKQLRLGPCPPVMHTHRNRPIHTPHAHTHHTGACLGALLSQGGLGGRRWQLPWFKRFWNDRDRRDFVACGTAAGGLACVRLLPRLLLQAVCAAAPHHATPRHTTPRHATPHHTTPHHTTPRHTTPHHTTPHHTTPRQTHAHQVSRRRSVRPWAACSLLLRR
jgi:hypothetical protein